MNPNNNSPNSYNNNHQNRAPIAYVHHPVEPQHAQSYTVQVPYAVIQYPYPYSIDFPPYPTPLLMPMPMPLPPIAPSDSPSLRPVPQDKYSATLTKILNEHRSNGSLSPREQRDFLICELFQLVRQLIGDNDCDTNIRSDVKEKEEEKEIISDSSNKSNDSKGIDIQSEDISNDEDGFNDAIEEIFKDKEEPDATPSHGSPIQHLVVNSDSDFKDSDTDTEELKKPITKPQKGKGRTCKIKKNKAIKQSMYNAYKEIVTKEENPDGTFTYKLNGSPIVFKKKTNCGKVFENHWKVMFQKLLEFKSKFGHTNATRVCSGYEDVGSWVAEQRRKLKKRRLEMEQFQSLNDIGFEWDRSYYFYNTLHKKN